MWTDVGTGPLARPAERRSAAQSEPPYANPKSWPPLFTVFAARWIVRRFAVPAASSSRLAMGVIALGLMLFAEFGLVLWLRHLSLRDYFATRDPVSGSVYYLVLLLFALMPLILARW
jgi:hypothetical protein